MIQKEYVEKNGVLVATVTFSLPSSFWADQIYLVGDFNDWNQSSLPFGRDRDGMWTLTIDFEVGRTYQFRYLFDGREWMNDNQADAYVHNPYGGNNCVLITDPSFTPHRDD
jgi:1,4-alpha-glucan branching enzyme